MTVTHFTGKNPNGSTVVLGHASTETMYDERHPLLRFVKKIAKEVITFDLPGHGSNALGKEEILTTPDFISQFKDIVDNFLDDTSVTYIGYSLGGLLGNKAFSQLQKNNIQIISIGAGLRLGEGSAERISSYFDVSMYSTPEARKYMEMHHGPHWENLVHSLRNVLTDPKLFPEKNELKWIQRNNFQFVLAEKDQAFSVDDITFAVDHNKIYQVPGNHFTYFRVGRPWAEVKEVIDTLIGSSIP